MLRLILQIPSWCLLWLLLTKMHKTTTLIRIWHSLLRRQAVQVTRSCSGH